MAEVIVTKWEEFKEAVSVVENTVICPPEVWDLSDETISELRISCQELQGNGLTLKGLYVTDRIRITSKNISDMNFLGVYAPFERAFIFVGKKTTFNRCGFSGESNNVFFDDSTYLESLSFVKCSFRVKCSYLTSYSQKKAFEDCDMRLVCSEKTCFNARNSRISGKLRGGVEMGYSLLFGENYGRSVINAEIPAEAEISMNGGLAGKKFLINKDLCLAPIPPELIPVTSAQLNDTGYLTSIGFLTGG